MKIQSSIIIAILIGCVSLQAMANDTRERMYLIQMKNQLDALKPLIISASHEQDTNLREKFHYTSYTDSTGIFHNGLLEDINAIQKGIQGKLNKNVNEPHHFQSIKGDYFNVNNIKSNDIGNVMENPDAK
jgi:RAQPRD family integrative conjugative element protein